MNQTLKKAMREIEALPETEQEELGQALLDMAMRKKIDARPASAVKRGGATPSEESFAELRARYRSEIVVNE